MFIYSFLYAYCLPLAQSLTQLERPLSILLDAQHLLIGQGPSSFWRRCLLRSLLWWGWLWNRRHCDFFDWLRIIPWHCTPHY